MSILVLTAKSNMEYLTLDLALFREAISFNEPVIFEAAPFNNDFTGPPRPEQDAVWHDLLKSKTQCNSFQLQELILIS